MFICNICNKVFDKKRSLASHKNHHNDEYKQKSLNGSKALRSEKAQKTRKKQYEDKKRKNWKQNNCITCGTELIYPQVKVWCPHEVMLPELMLTRQLLYYLTIRAYFFFLRFLFLFVLTNWKNNYFLLFHQ